MPYGTMVRSMIAPSPFATAGFNMVLMKFRQPGQRLSTYTPTGTRAGLGAARGPGRAAPAPAASAASTTATARAAAPGPLGLARRMLPP